MNALLKSIAEQFGSLSRTESMIAVGCLFVAAYALFGLWRIARRESLADRLSGVRRLYADRVESATADQLDRDAIVSQRWYQRLGAVVAATSIVGPTDRIRLTRLLANAGIAGGKYQLATLIAVKLAMLVVVAAATWFAITFYGLFVHWAIIRFIVVLGAVLIGWRVPDMVLTHMAAERTERIEHSLPDVLDLMVISAEAGLSFEQGLEFVSREMAQAMPDISQELSVTSAELRVLGDRRQALQNFADRVNLQAVRSIVATLVQTMRYGTPLAQSLRSLSAEMRSARLLRMEERAARMPVLLTLPLMGFILPSLVLVCIGPAILQAIDGFRELMK